MSDDKKFYQLTSEGKLLWAKRDKVPLPLDYRRVLGLVEYSGHAEVIRTHLARFPKEFVDRWLKEFQELRLIEAVAAPADEKSLPALLEDISAPPIEPEDVEHSAPEVSFADVSLSRLGVYVNSERVANRPKSSKSPSSTEALVVEDDSDQLALAVLRLTMANYKVRTADSAAALYKMLEQGLPDALFLDINLPDGDGFDLLSALRRHPKYAHLPIIMLTARTDPADVARGLAIGCDGYVTKPYGRNTLEYVLRYVMRQELSIAASAQAA